jgi:hypothetical protein
VGLATARARCEIYKFWACEGEGERTFDRDLHVCDTRIYMIAEMAVCSLQWRGVGVRRGEGSDMAHGE